MISSQELGVPILFLNPSELHEFVEITIIPTLCFLEIGNITLLLYNTFFLQVLTYYGTQKERRLKRVGWTKPNAFHVCITSYKLVTTDHSR